MPGYVQQNLLAALRDFEQSDRPDDEKRHGVSTSELAAIVFGITADEVDESRRVIVSRALNWMMARDKLVEKTKWRTRSPESYWRLVPKVRAAIFHQIDTGAGKRKSKR